MSRPSASISGVTGDKIAELMAAYEEHHAVEGYEAYGWQVWPFVRTAVASHIEWEIYGGDPNKDTPAPGARAAARLDSLRFYLDAVGGYLRWAFSILSGKVRSPAAPCDVLFVASGARYQQLGERWVHYATGPTADLIEAAGLTCRVWQWNAQPTPAERTATDIVPPLRLRQRLGGLYAAFRRPPPEPAWFAEVAAFYRTHVGKALTWDWLERELRSVTKTSALMDRWLDRARPRLVVNDCWATAPTVAATMAAHRRGIPVLEVQHGFLEWSHYAYHWWVKAPAEGWAAMPDFIWLWGERGAALNRRTNRIPQQILVGGNPWLGRWLDGSDPLVAEARARAASIREGYGRAVLVTLQSHSATGERWLAEVVAASPPDWIWLIRTHPIWPNEGLELAGQLDALSEATVIGHLPSDMPLYALLSAIDLHVTLASTCANEALAFGKPTLLMDPNGLAVFPHEVEAGLMAYVPAAEFYDAAQRAMAIDPARLKQAAEPLFLADKAAGHAAVQRLLELIGEREAA